MRNYGIEASSEVYWPGFNGHMCELHALVGLHNLRRLPELTSMSDAEMDHVVGALAEALAIVTRRSHEALLLERPE